MIVMIAKTIVILTGLYFICLSLAALAAPALAARFLHGFAGTVLAHYLELGIRLAVGGAFVVGAPDMLGAGAMAAFGWVILISTIVLLCIPWRWHRGFAQRSVPYAVQFLKFFGIISMALGGIILFAVIRGVWR